MLTPLRVGDILYGFCGGFFGRDSYDDKRIEAVGSDWVVARQENGTPVFGRLPSSTDQSIDEWLEEYRTPEADRKIRGDRW